MLPPAYPSTLLSASGAAESRSQSLSLPESSRVSAAGAQLSRLPMQLLLVMWVGIHSSHLCAAAACAAGVWHCWDPAGLHDGHSLHFSILRPVEGTWQCVCARDAVGLPRYINGHQAAIFCDPGTSRWSHNAAQPPRTTAQLLS